MTAVFYKVFSALGWIDSEDPINMIRGIYSVSADGTVKEEKVAEQVETSDAIRYSSSDGSWNALTSSDLSVLCLGREYGVANGDRQTNGIGLKAVNGKHLLLNAATSRFAVPSELEFRIPSGARDPRSYETLKSMVQMKCFGLSLLKMTAAEAGTFLELWREKYGGLFAGDDRMAGRLQEVVLAAGHLSTIGKTETGRIVVKPLETANVISSVRPCEPGRNVLKYLNEDGEQIHAVCRASDGSVFVM